MENDKSPRALKAILFDLDGVLADTEPIHFMMFQRVLKEEGLPLSRRDYYDKYVGLDDKGCFHAILTAHARPVSPELIQQLIERKAVMLQDSLKAHLGLFPGVVEFVAQAAARYRLAIVSGALRHEIHYILETAGIRKAFEHITAAEDVHNGKPDPEGYLHALRSLNQTSTVHAAECLVIEDTPPGIEAAHGAGMRCLAVANTYPVAQLMTADAIAETLKDYDLTALERRLWS
jgi:HAD superfamily hydrolase (TIGR01509 family)